VFIAGATISGLPQSHARSTDVTRLSHKPWREREGRGREGGNEWSVFRFR
jgi:hypothetical protein